MTTKQPHDYLLRTGEADYERLSISNKLYNPLAIYFLKNSGIKEGMTVLEIGCGTGHMACELAKLVGPTGKVIAIDNSPAQINVAKKTAEHAGITNIEFLVHSMYDLDKLDREYDATYGRWVLEFSEDPAAILKELYRGLKNGGILAYEASDMLQTQFFSSPYTSTVGKYCEIMSKMFASAKFNLTFGSEAFHEFKKLGCHHIQTLVNQPIAKTPKEKSLYRLGIHTSSPTLLAKNIMTQQEIDDYCHECEKLENSDVICASYKNILISGIK